MMSTPRLYAWLFIMGAGWGLTVPLSKIAVTTGHQPFGLIFWQLLVVIAVLGVICAARRKPLKVGQQYWRLLIAVALTGAVLPDVFFYVAAAQLPGGIMAIVVSSVPMFSLPIALAMGVERFAWLRFFGLMLGVGGILLLIAPEASLPSSVAALYVLIALCAPFFYAMEGNLVAKWGTQDLDAVQVLLGASIIGILFALPLAYLSGQWINPLETGLGLAEISLVLGAAVHALVYAGYVWMVGRAGAVFTAQVSYMVTACGVLWSILLLNEWYAGTVWAALGLMMCGMFLVQPRQSTLAPGTGIRKNESEH